METREHNDGQPLKIYGQPCTCNSWPWAKKNVPVTVFMVDQMVDLLPFFMENLQDQMVNFFVTLCLKTTGNYSCNMFDGLSGIWTRDFSIANRTFVPSWTISPCFALFYIFKTFIIIYVFNDAVVHILKSVVLFCWRCKIGCHFHPKNVFICRHFIFQCKQ